MRRVVLIGRREAAAQGDVDVVQRHHCPGIAAHLGVVAGVSVRHNICGLVQQRTYFAALGTTFTHRFVVVEVQQLTLLKPEILLRAHDHAGHPRHREHVGPIP